MIPEVPTRVVSATSTVSPCSVAMIQRTRALPRIVPQHDHFPTLKAYRSKPSASPGRGWNLVPACDTSDNELTGPGISLLAVLTPFTSAVAY